MVEANRASSPIAEELAADVAYIVDEYHATGHVGRWCAEHCLPNLPENVALLNGFPTNICEIVNSELSPLGHTVHHMGRWTCQLFMQEVVDVYNIKTSQKKAERQQVAERSCEGSAPR